MTSSLGPPPLNTLHSSIPLLPLQPPPQYALSQPTAEETLLMYSTNGLLYGEEISTIFVVGFPDDMQEREFQNMFIFSPGFEAATLKVPSKDGEEDPVATQNNSNKKQIIGFAKFRTRAEALDAKDIISGRKVDAEKGSILKAEMAKKNLHTKRGLSLNDTQDDLSMATTTMKVGNHSTAYEAFHSVPASDPALNSDIYTDLFVPRNNSSSTTTHRPLMTAPTTASAATTPTAVRPPNLFSPTTSTTTTAKHRFSSSGNLFDLTQPLNLIDNPGPLDYHQHLHQHLPSFSAPETILSPSPSSSITQALPQHSYSQKHLHSTSPPHRFMDDEPFITPFHGLTINTHSHSHHQSATASGLPSPGMLSPTATYRHFFFSASLNPADQNPPCNTLYVGNLPYNTDEDELRNLFATRCLGYKRLSFRQKANGPMCFVEFDDVYCASQALQELYGNPLSNSIKGGIRLSFSKNPLGVRGHG